MMAMTGNYAVYENLYNYMNYLLNPDRSIQGESTANGLRTNGSPRGSKASGSKSFVDTFKDTAGVTGVPESMDSIFEEAAKLYGVPVQLLKAVGKAESGFNANAVSAVGAQGVMQLMPATARYLGVDNPFDATSNIMGRAKYIAEKLKEYDGDVELALAAYNAGSGNVAKYGGVPPFTETINYIDRIMGYMGTDLTTGKTVQTAGEQQGMSYVSDSTEKGTGGMSVSDVMSQYYMAQIQLKMVERMNDLGQSLQVSGGSEKEQENEEERYFL